MKRKITLILSVLPLLLYSQSSALNYTVLGGGGEFQDVLIIFGQSNEEGRGVPDSAKTYSVTNSRIHIFEKNNNSSTGTGSWDTLDATSGNNIDPADRDLGYRWVGHEIAFGQMYYDSTGRELYIIKVGRGSTAMYAKSGNYTTSGRDFNKNSSDDYYQILTQRYISQALDSLTRPRIIGATMHQGEEDGNDTVWAKAYYNNLKAMTEALRVYDSRLTNLKIAVSRVQSVPTEFPYIYSIRKAQDSLAYYHIAQDLSITTPNNPVTSDINMCVLNIDDLEVKGDGDIVHLSAEAQEEKGERLFQTFVNLGWIKY
jgi:hypothetical protein